MPFCGATDTPVLDCPGFQSQSESPFVIPREENLSFVPISIEFYPFSIFTLIEKK